MEREARDELEVEALRKGQELQESHTKIAERSSQVDNLHKQLSLLRGQSTKLEERSMKVEDEVSLLKQEFPKRLKDSANEAVENFQQSEAFWMQAVLSRRSTLVAVFKEISKDILKIDVNIPLDYLPSMKDF